MQRVLLNVNGLMLVAATLNAQAQQANFPTRPIRLIAANSAGGGLDLVSRAVSPKLSAVFGHQVIVDNRAGAAGSVASEIVSKSAPDGYTLLCSSLGGLAVNTHLYSGLTFNPLKDFAALTFASSQGNLIVVNPSVPVKTMQELTAHIKANPGKLTYGSSGAGNAGHLATELYLNMIGGKMVHVPYKGGSPAMIDLIANQVQVVFSSAATAVPQVKAGKIRGLAVTSLQRTALIDLPTVQEAGGLKGYELIAWFAAYAPRGTPQAVIERLNSAINTAANSKDVKDRLIAFGVETSPHTPAQLAERTRAETVKWAKAIKDAGIQPE